MLLRLCFYASWGLKKRSWADSQTGEQMGGRDGGWEDEWMGGVGEMGGWVVGPQYPSRRPIAEAGMSGQAWVHEASSTCAQM